MIPHRKKEKPKEHGVPCITAEVNDVLSFDPRNQVRAEHLLGVPSADAEKAVPRPSHPEQAEEDRQTFETYAHHSMPQGLKSQEAI